MGIFFAILLFSDEQIEVSVIKSLIEPKTISAFVTKNYAVEGDVKSRILSLGVNDIYLIEIDDQKYVLRLSRTDKYTNLTCLEFFFELEWLDFLKNRNIPVAYPIQRKDGQLYGSIKAPEGCRYATVFSFAEGNTSLTSEQAFKLGSSLAKLHIASDDFKPSITRNPLDLKYLIDDAVEQIVPYLDQAQEVVLVDIALKIKRQIQALHFDEACFGMVSGDFHGYNQHFTSENCLTMFDFEFCGFSYRIYDIATFKWGRGSSSEIWESFLGGYQSVRPLSDAEIKAIPLFEDVRNIWWMGAMTTLPDYQHTLDARFWNNAFRKFITHSKAL